MKKHEKLSPLNFCLRLSYFFFFWLCSKNKIRLLDTQTMFCCVCLSMSWSWYDGYWLLLISNLLSCTFKCLYRCRYDQKMRKLSVWLKLLMVVLPTLVMMNVYEIQNSLIFVWIPDEVFFCLFLRRTLIIQTMKIRIGTRRVKNRFNKF